MINILVSEVADVRKTSRNTDTTKAARTRVQICAVHAVHEHRRVQRAGRSHTHVLISLAEYCRKTLSPSMV